METVAEHFDGTTSSRKQVQRSELKFPVYALADALTVPDAIHRKGGGIATDDQLAAYLGYKGKNNGAYIDKISAARLFGFIEKRGAEYGLTPRAKQVLMPEFEEDRQQGLVDAFFEVPLFKAMFDA